MSTGPTLNPAAIQALRELSPEGDAEFLRELITIYLTDTPKQFAQLEDAITRQDAALATRTAHTIKGSSGNFGAAELSRLAHEIENFGKANNLAAVAAALPSFKAQFERVAEALRQIAGT